MPMNDRPRANFDFSAFKRAFVAQDISAWLEFFDENAEWVEYKHAHPPRAPRRMVGREQIAGFLRGVKASNVTLAIEDEVIGAGRAAFRVWCTLPDGRRIIEHVIIEFPNGRITRQVDVEAWD